MISWLDTAHAQEDAAQGPLNPHQDEGTGGIELEQVMTSRRRHSKQLWSTISPPRPLSASLILASAHAYWRRCPASLHTTTLLRRRRFPSASSTRYRNWQPSGVGQDSPAPSDVLASDHRAASKIFRGHTMDAQSRLKSLEKRKTKSGTFGARRSRTARADVSASICVAPITVPKTPAVAFGQHTLPAVALVRRPFLWSVRSRSSTDTSP
ncbi:hypothetical protein FB45DRAFT_946756 [Roridomyces roridus]|uniref:Uncharacterized protein n=1 Tax=Roridomyces roridus TaxID=1738132 RepID=A0AAD7FAL5_9AGAR|nr:hypothetical protein FB45DRAFT_946756 [Roridomyces roridus]